GRVGRRWTGRRVGEGATFVITDVRQEAIDAVRRLHPDIEVVADTDEMVRTELDVFAPCAMGGVLHDGNVDTLSAQIVCGAANNQLAHPGIAEALRKRGVLYAP